MKWPLSTGREFYAHGGILGLSVNDPGVLFHGYDGIVCEDDYPEVGDEAPFTDEERAEIAQRMIGLWKAWGRLT